jgi:hypothetical protein
MMVILSRHDYSGDLQKGGRDLSPLGLVNLQEVKGEAKPYQIRQFLRLVERHNLRLEEDS